MVIPLIIGGVTLVGGVWYAIDKSDGKLEEIAGDTARDLLEEGIPYVNSLAAGLQSIGEDIGEGLGDIGDDLAAGLADFGGDIAEGLGDLGEGLLDFGEGLGSATLDVIENIGITIIKAGAKTKEFIVDEIGDRRVTFVKQFTILIIVLMTTVFIYNSLMIRDK